MPKASHNALGFTLIELLVVISIIGVLASVVLASLSGARTKGNEAVIKQELIQFRNLYEMVYSNTGSYAALQPTRMIAGNTICQNYTASGSGYVCKISGQPACNAVFGLAGEIPNADALALCKQIIQNASFFEIGVDTSVTYGIGSTNINRHYSMIAFMPTTGKYMCMGDSGRNSTISLNQSGPSTSAGELDAGCPGNP